MPSSSHSPLRFFLGADGGGTNTRVLISSEDGTVCGLGLSGGSNPNQFGPAVASLHLREAFEAAWVDAGREPEPLEGAFLGVAGLASFQKTAAPECLIEWMPRAPKAVVRFDHDLRIALAGGLNGRPGIVLIAGTGSSGYGLTADHQSAIVGGWGSLLDDVGSGYWLGLHGLIAITRASDGRGIQTSLTDVLLDQIGVSEPAGLLPWLRASQGDRKKIAALAPVVLAAAAAGDVVAERIIGDGVEELAAIVLALGRGLFAGGAAEYTFAGGLSKNADYTAALQKKLGEKAPDLRLTRPVHSPVVGALWLAMTQTRRAPRGDALRAADTKAPF